MMNKAELKRFLRKNNAEVNLAMARIERASKEFDKLMREARALL